MQRAHGFIVWAVYGTALNLIFASIGFGQVHYGATQAPQTTQSTYQHQPIFQPPQLSDPARQQPRLMQTLQTPPKAVIHNGVTVYQQEQATQYQRTQYRAGETPGRSMPPGYGSPYPTGLDPNAPRVASTQTDPNRPTGSVYNLYGSAPEATPATPQPPTGGAYAPPLTAPHAAQPQAVPAPGAQRVHVGRSEPDNVVPFFLKPEEQQELDEFLARWEEYSKTIKRYDVDFNCWVYDPTIPGSVPGQPHKRPFGSFKYIAPNRFAFHIEGEWVNGAKLKRDKSRPQIVEEKIIIDGKSVFYFDFNAERVRQIDIPPEMIGKGIADSPLPLIFGAKAIDMKRRFSMRIVTSPQRRDEEIWLQARPLLIEDRQEFREIEIRLDKKTLRAKSLRKSDINGKSYDAYVFENVKINNGLATLFDDLKKYFVAETPRGWKHEVVDWTPDASPGPEHATPRPGVASPAGQPNAPARNEIPLYTPGN